MATNVISDIESLDVGDGPLAVSTPNLSEEINVTNNAVTPNRSDRSKHSSWSSPFLSCFNKFLFFHNKHFGKMSKNGVNSTLRPSTDVTDIFDSFLDANKATPLITNQPPRIITSSTYPRTSRTYSFQPKTTSSETPFENRILPPSTGFIGELPNSPLAQTKYLSVDSRILSHSARSTQRPASAEVRSADRRVISLRQLELGLQSLGITSTVETWKLVYGSFNVTSIDQPIYFEDCIKIVKQFFSLELHLNGITEEKLQSIATVRVTTEDESKSKMKTLKKENRKLRESLREEITVRNETEKILLKIRKVVQDIIKDCEKLKRDVNLNYMTKSPRCEQMSSSKPVKRHTTERKDRERLLPRTSKSSESTKAFWV